MFMGTKLRSNIDNYMVAWNLDRSNVNIFCVTLDSWKLIINIIWNVWLQLPRNVCVRVYLKQIVRFFLMVFILKGKISNLLYSSHKVKYFKPFLVLILMKLHRNCFRKTIKSFKLADYPYLDLIRHNPYHWSDSWRPHPQDLKDPLLVPDMKR